MLRFVREPVLFILFFKVPRTPDLPYGTMQYRGFLYQRKDRGNVVVVLKRPELRSGDGRWLH